MSQNQQEMSQADIADLDWDDVPETGDMTDEGDTEESAAELEDSSSKPTGKEPSESDSEATDEDSEAPGKDIDSKGEDKSGEGESPVKNSEVKSLDDFSDDDVIKVKIDGELQEVTLKEFKSGISGTKAIAKRFSEYDKKEKEFKKELNDVNEYVNTFAAKMNQKDPVAALEYLTSFTNIPAYEVKDMLIQSLMPEIERRAALNEDQLYIEKNKSKLEFEKKQIETERQKFDKEQANSALQKQIDSVRQTHNIEPDSWSEAFDYLDKNLPPEQEITISAVKEYVLFSRAESVIKEVDESLVSNKMVLNGLMNIQEENPDFTVEDLKYIVEKSYVDSKQDKVKSELEEAAHKKGSASKTNQKTQKAPQAFVNEAGEEIDDWDDIL